MKYFMFKQFNIHHDRCAMKVGTDGVLLGAWADIKRATQILDIGCGSGLITLMAAQRSKAHVTGLEIDAIAAEQAQENCQASPFAKRTTIIHEDLKTFYPNKKFDCILSNPPFFAETLLPPDKRRATARHTQELTYSTLIENARRLMLPNTMFHVILPYTILNHFISLCSINGLSLLRQTNVITSPRKTPKRVLLTFTNNISATHPTQDTLLLNDQTGNRSYDYTQLTKDFYLDRNV